VYIILNAVLKQKAVVWRTTAALSSLCLSPQKLLAIDVEVTLIYGVGRSVNGLYVTVEAHGAASLGSRD